jgi:inner membrane transporter RhtA
VVVVGYGGALAGMNVLFYEAIARLPMGTAVTLEILGPLALSVLASRRWLRVLWATLALTGVVLLGHGGLTDLDAVGAAVAALSSLLPYALEAINLRRLPRSTFAVLMSLAPAVAAATGAVLLGQRIDAIGALAIVRVVAASAGAVASSARRRHHDHQAPRPSAQSSSLQDHRAVS